MTIPIDPMLAAVQSQAHAAWSQYRIARYGTAFAFLAAAANALTLVWIYLSQRADGQKRDSRQQADAAEAADRRLAIARLNGFDGMLAMERTFAVFETLDRHIRIKKSDLAGPLATARRQFELVLTAEVFDKSLRATVQRADALATLMQVRIDSFERDFVTRTEIEEADAAEIQHLKRLRAKLGEVVDAYEGTPTVVKAP